MFDLSHVLDFNLFLASLCPAGGAGGDAGAPCPPRTGAAGRAGTARAAGPDRGRTGNRAGPKKVMQIKNRGTLQIHFGAPLFPLFFLEAPRLHGDHSYVYKGGTSTQLDDAR